LTQLLDYYGDFLSVAFGHDPSAFRLVHSRSLPLFAASTLSPALGLLRTAHFNGGSASIPGQNETSGFKSYPPRANIQEGWAPALELFGLQRRIPMNEPIHLAGATLDVHRHVCAFFPGARTRRRQFSHNLLEIMTTLVPLEFACARLES
jgi:hypothetical protein